MARKKALHRDEIDPFPFDSSDACYNPAHDGSLEEYFKTHDGSFAFPLFKGFDHFELLRKEGWLGPRMSIIRLMWNVGRGDEHFMVTDEFKLEGLVAEAHSGREGIHEPAELFKGAPPFEAQHVLFPKYRESWLKTLEKIRRHTSA